MQDKSFFPQRFEIAKWGEWPTRPGSSPQTRRVALLAAPLEAPLRCKIERALTGPIASFFPHGDWLSVGNGEIGLHLFYLRSPEAARRFHMKPQFKIPSVLLALLFLAAILVPSAYGAPSDQTANGVTTGTSTTGSTPPSPSGVTGAGSPAAASSGSPGTTPSGVYRGTGSSPQNQATGDANSGNTATKP